ncbi:MAG: hypothetical protein COT26_01255, partial [Candidatus Kerfeldbacteria bacterium CG08_land_8_20_14_0_20_43_14]
LGKRVDPFIPALQRLKQVLMTPLSCGVSWNRKNPREARVCKNYLAFNRSWIVCDRTVFADNHFKSRMFGSYRKAGIGDLDPKVEIFPFHNCFGYIQRHVKTPGR